MPPADIPFTYCSRKKLKTGWKDYWRFRHPNYGESKLPGTPGDKAFHQRYVELLTAAERADPAPAPNSFEWLVNRYLASAEYKALRPSTQGDYSDTCDLLKSIDALKSLPYRLIDRTVIKTIRDSYADTPRKAHKIKQVVSRLYGWADEEGLVADGYNPAKGIKRLKVRPKPIEPWLDDEIARYLSEATEFEALPVMIGLYTGQRREDVAEMRWNQWQGDTIRCRQSKTGALIDIPCHHKLRTFLERVERKAVTICYTSTGRATNAGRLSGIVNRRLTRAGIKDRSFHGLRYSFAALLEEAGGTVEEGMSILGHHAWQMSVKYMVQRKRSKRAMEKMENVA